VRELDRAMASKKRRREPEPDLGGLYDFLPPPDPDKDAAAKAAAELKNKPKPRLPPEERSRVIFLDIDGVLVPAGSMETIWIDGIMLPIRPTIKESDFNAASLANLRSIVQRTGAGIVLSSEWRRTETLSSSVGTVLRANDIPQFRDSTPIFKPSPDLQKLDPAVVWCERRAREITSWLKEHREVTAWVAIDDLDFAWADQVKAPGTSFIKYRSVLTNPQHCITEANADEAVGLLLEPPPEPRPAPRVVQEPASSSSAEGTRGVIASTEDSGPDVIRLG